MKKLKCGNESTYEIYNDTVCCPSGNANVRSYFEIWMPEDVMEFSEFEALVRDKEAMQKLTVMTDKGAEEAVFLNYTLPVEWKLAARRACLLVWSSLHTLNKSWQNWV